MAVATRVGARVRWVVCSYGGVSTCEVDDAITHDTSVIAVFQEIDGQVDFKSWVGVKITRVQPGTHESM